jgi:hydrogenase maturation protease
MPRIVAIGYGNPLRGDDGVGYRAAERLAELIRDPEIEIIAAHQLLPEIMEQIASSERVILIDANAEGPPGEIRERDVAGSPSAGRFTHDLSADGMIAGARSLYGWTGTATLISIAGVDFGPGMELSEPVRDALETVLHRVAAHCKLP